MNFFQKFILVVVFMIFGTGVVILAEEYIPKAMDNKNPNKNVMGIGGVLALQDQYYIDQPLSTHGAKICLEVEDDRGLSVLKYVDLEEENVENFSSNSVGNFEMKVKYDKFSYEVPYSVKYKKISVGDQKFDFELDQDVDYSAYKLYCYDFFDNVSLVTTLADADISGVDTSVITSEDLTASVHYENLITYFDYSVFYFSRTQNYISQNLSVDDECSFELLKFVGAKETSLSICKRILKYDIVEGIYTFSLKRVDGKNSSTFLTSDAVAKLDHQTKKLTVFEGVLGNLSVLEFDLKLGNEKTVREPMIKAISKVKNFSQEYILNEKCLFDDLKISLLMSDNSTKEVEISKDNISNFSLSKVGVFTAKISYFNFEFYQTYYVNYGKIELYNQPDEIVFSLNGDDLQNLEIVCYDYEGKPVAIKSLKSADVLVSKIDTTTPCERQTARISCYGAGLEFVYSVR